MLSSSACAATEWETGTEAFAPFGTGGRRCYGRKQAMATIRLVVARFVVDTQTAFTTGNATVKVRRCNRPIQYFASPATLYGHST